MHTEARRNRPPSYPKRTPVPAEKVTWSVKFPDYAPPYFVHPAVIRADRRTQHDGWADPEKVDLVEHKLVSFEGRVTWVDGFPRNPRGRTGMRGRGLLGCWGANFAADAIVVRKTAAELEMIAIERKDSGQWAIPGGMVDGDEEPHATAARELEEETGVILDMSQATLVYRGYVDDRRNTDNAWMETTALLRQVSAEEAAEFSLRGGDDAAKAQWKPMVNNFIDRLYASHGQMIRTTLELLAR